MRAAIALICIVTAAPAAADWPGQASAIYNSAGSSAPGLYPYLGSASADTPPMRRQKIEQSSALREEAARLEAADGGTLSAEHVAYIRKRVRQILGRSALDARTGSLIAQR